MRLIGLHARLHAGKDTAYSVIERAANDDSLLALRRAFADPLKVSGMRALGTSTDLENDYVVGLANLIKETGRITVSWEDENGLLESWTLTGRQFWQNYGTESHRVDDLGDSFGPDFWIDNLLPVGTVGTKTAKEDLGVSDTERPLFWDNFKESWAGYADIAVVTDVRFPNEAQRVRDLGGEVWKIDADQRLGENLDGHASEVPLPDDLIDVVIDNNGSVAEFQNNVLEAL